MASIRKYQNRAIETAAVIEELIALVKQMREAAQCGAGLSLSDDEVAFYDALALRRLGWVSRHLDISRVLDTLLP